MLEKAEIGQISQNPEEKLEKFFAKLGQEKVKKLMKGLLKLEELKL